jgi:hypothetical protein
MATFTKKILSGSTDGMPIKVVATATAGTLIHTGSSTAANLQEIWIWAQNNHTADVVLTIEYGDATAPDHNIISTIKTKAGLSLILPGILLKGNTTPITVKAFAGTANVIVLTGFVNEIA